MQYLKVLCIDGDLGVRKLLQRDLAKYGYQVITGTSGQELVGLLSQHMPDLLIFELDQAHMLEGLEICTGLRKWNAVPLVIIASSQDKTTEIAAFDAGADDYILKPLDMPMLAARMRAILRRAAIAKAHTVTGTVQISDLELDLIRRRVTLKSEEIHLTPKEYELLCLLITNAGKVLTHRTLLEAIWRNKEVKSDHYLKVYINTIRKKLQENHLEPSHYIITEPGIGYRFIEA